MNNEQFGTDQDKEISVEIIGDENPFCFKITIGEYDFNMHARSVQDLDWQSQTLKQIMEQL